MTGQKRTRYERQLLRERAEAARVLAATPVDAEMDFSTTDRADLATIAVEKDMDRMVNTIESTAVGEIDAALARMQSDPDAFGRCVTCGCDIPPARLDLLPATRYCAAHAPER
jgi:RNA polymerase-binding transcription factor DksA